MGKRLVFLTSFVVVAAGLGVGAILSLRHTRTTTPLPAEVVGLPADTVAVLGLDVRRIAGHPLYEKMKPLTRLPEFWRDVETAFGHQPERDVDQAWLGCTTLQARGYRCLLILRGRFDASRLAGAVTNLAWRRKDRGGVPTYSRGDGFSVALLDPGTLVVATSPDLVRGFADDRRAGRQGLRGNTALMAPLTRLKSGASLWLVGTADSLAPLQQSLGSLRGLLDLSRLRGLALTADFQVSADIELALEAGDQETAEGLGALIAAALSGAKLQVLDQNPLTELASRANVTTDGTRVLVRATLSPDVLESVLRHR